MKQDLSQHSMYCDEGTIRKMTEWHLEQGHSVFQLFQFGANEQQHSQSLLNTLALPLGATVLSLGCGVGGMEKYWQDVRPDLQFELVNITPTQLEMCICKGKLVLADAEGYISSDRFDAVIISYMLGHVDVQNTLKSAVLNLKVGGKLMVYEPCDSNAQFDELLQYNSPSSKEIMKFGFDNDMKFRTVLQGGIAPCSFVQRELPWVAQSTTPCLFVLESTNES